MSLNQGGGGKMGRVPESRYAIANGLRLHYVDWDNPETLPMVLLHGLRAYGHWFDEFAEAVCSRYRVIALDQRGRGDSEHAADGDYTTDAYVSDLEVFVDTLRLDRFILGGHSMGGINAVHYTARHPGRVVALLILDIGPDVNPAGLERVRRELAATPRRFDSWKEARTFIRRLHPNASEQSINTRLSWMLKEAPGGIITWRFDQAILGPAAEPDPPARMWDSLAKCPCPTLVVRGELSDFVTAETCERMAGVLPAGRWVEIPAAGHMVIEDNPTAFNRVVSPFLDECVRHR